MPGVIWSILPDGETCRVVQGPRNYTKLGKWDNCSLSCPAKTKEGVGKEEGNEKRKIWTTKREKDEGTKRVKMNSRERKIEKMKRK